MGSDLYMEQQNFRPGPPRISWLDRDNILIKVAQTVKEIS